MGTFWYVAGVGSLDCVATDHNLSAYSLTILSLMSVERAVHQRKDLIGMVLMDFAASIKLRSRSSICPSEGVGDERETIPTTCNVIEY